jgi:hypothetical protein
MFDKTTSRVHLDPFLIPTEICDSDNSLIVAKAKELVGKTKDIWKAADSVRSFLRKEVVYTFDYCSTKASETLQKMEGMCTNKANLQVALMRSLGIPAGYGLVHITKEVFVRDVVPEMYEKISEPTTHVFACVWIPEFDRFCYFDSTERNKDFMHLMVELPTGETRYQDRWLRGTIHVHANLDHLFKRASRWTREEFEQQNKVYRGARP